MAKRFENASQGLIGIIYGRPGCGKTTLMGTMSDDERFGRVLDLDVFGNPQVLARREKKPDIVMMERLEDFNEPYQWLVNDQSKNDSFAKELQLTPPYQTLLIDGTTEVQRFITGLITGSTHTDPGTLTNALGRQGFGQLLGTMMNWAKHFIELSQLGLNVFFTCLEAEKKDESMVSHYEPLIWGQSGLELCGYALLVGRLTTRLKTDREIKGLDDDVLVSTTYNVLQIQPTTATYAKDQYGCGVTHIVNPTMAKVMDLIRQSSQ
jgi:hypothetical protein